MKTALLGTIIGLLIAVSATTSCSINHRSDQYACTKSSDCEPGRTCSDGFCITGEGPVVDAGKVDAPKTPDGGQPGCPSQCTSCNATTKSCVIDCAMANGACNQPIVCPAGFKCDIRCNQDNACRQGINCLQGASCQISCSARQSCDQVACGPGACSVTCNGVQSCRNVACGNSCACDVMCTGNQACFGGSISCSSIACRSGLGCTSSPNLCHSCQ
ncbi:MAG: hypothetical protein HOV81_16475 [Kofleriaceae bacterium]|nr:hypothetical protein [Kofleriaceae bacterium]